MKPYLSIYKGYLISERPEGDFHVSIIEDGAPPLGIAKFTVDACKEWIDQHPRSLSIDHSEVVFEKREAYFVAQFKVATLVSPYKAIEYSLSALDIDDLFSKVAYSLGLITTWPE